MNQFAQYLQQHNLEALTLAIAARVRYLTVYNATKGNPISLKDAEMIRQAAFHLTGVAYRGVFATRSNQQPLDQQPTRPLQNGILKSF